MSIPAAVLVLPEGSVGGPICSGGKKVLSGEPEMFPISDVTCKNCLKLH